MNNNRTQSVFYSGVFALFFLCGGLSPLLSQPAFRFDVKMGIDVVVEENFSRFAGKDIILLTNQSGRTRTLASTAELFAKSRTCNLRAIFSPEHGYYGSVYAGDSVAQGDSVFGVPIISLYGSMRRPDTSFFEENDVVVVDIQDIGIRSYTYISTLYNVMDACASSGTPIVILDRPNPLGGTIIDGNVLDTAVKSFVGIIPVPYIHGCTMGELALMINGEGWLPRQQPAGGKRVSNAFLPIRQCSLEVVPMQQWERWMLWEDTDFTWTPTSPHIPTVNAVRGAAVLGPLGELGIVNIGIGYTLPFQHFGLPTLQVDMLDEFFRREQFAGISFVPTRYVPFYGGMKGMECKGFRLHFYPDRNFAPFSTGIEIATALKRVAPELFAPLAEKRTASNDMFAKVMGSRQLAQALIGKGSYQEIKELSTAGIEEFRELREKYLLYH